MNQARKLLAPFTPLYRLGLNLRERRLASGREPIRRLRFPVVSIGNLSTGGSGKTPMTIALVNALTERGFSVDVLSRGYGRSGLQAARVRPDGTAEEFGDEPLLIARQSGAPVYVAAQRYEAGLLAEHLAVNALKGTGFNPYVQQAEVIGALAPEGRTLHLLDDGFQHRQLHRDIDIVLLNRADWQDRLLPAGNLREPRQALRRAHVLAIPAAEPELETELRAWGWAGPIWRLRRPMEIPRIDGPVVAFCGIARPEQFFAGLEASGLGVAGRHAFPDHHRYAARDLDRLAASARAAGAAALITTEKDAVRLALVPGSFPVHTVRLRTEIDDESSAFNWLVRELKTVRPTD